MSRVFTPGINSASVIRGGALDVQHRAGVRVEQIGPEKPTRIEDRRREIL
jgi:hypothetical protein